MSEPMPGEGEPRLQCVGCGAVAITTIAHLSACEECHRKYQKEAKQYLPMHKRTFLMSFIDKARDKRILSAVNYTFSGY